MKTIKTRFNLQTTLFLLAALASLFTINQANAAGVDLDNSFGTNGVVSKTFGPILDFPFASAIDGNGKIVTVGSIMDGSRDTASIIRYNSDGTVDETFGIRSEQIFNEAVQFYTDVLIQPDGKILVSGDLTFNNENWQFLVRYLANGNRDFAFNVPLAPRPVGGNYSIGKIELQNDGKIILAATVDPLSGRSDLFLTRFNPNGSLDNSFGSSGNGTVITSTDVDNDERVIDVKLQSDGKIVVFGYVFSGIGGARRLGLFRYNTDGTIDTTFGTNGVAIDDYGLFALLPRGQMGIQTDDKILFSSYAKTESNGEYKFLIIRYDTDGTLDATFDSDGIVATQIQQRSFADGLAIQSDGKILAGGSTSDGTTSQAVIARYNSDGSLDATFDGDGIITKLPEDSSGVTNIIQKPDGKLVGIGTSRLSSTNRNSFLLFGLNTDGSADSSLFGNDGVAIHPVGSKQNYAREVIIQPDGKLVTVGSTTGGNSTLNIGVARFEADGTVDSGFGTDGAVIFENGSGNNFIESVTGALQSDGKIVAAGRIRTNGSQGIAVLRLNSDGSPDTTFGEDGFGIVTSNIGIGTAPNPIVRAVRMQQDGKILVLGWLNITGDPNNFDNDIFLARINPDGSFDKGFDGDGIVTFANSSGNDFAAAMKIQTDGKITVLGTINDGNNKTNDIKLIRFNSDGSTDNVLNIADAFGITAGHNFTSFDCTSDGKYVIGGSIATENPSVGESILVQMNPDGTADTAFGNNGISLARPSQDNNGIYEILIEPGGKIIAAGQAFSGVFPLGKSNIYLFRFKSNGLLDDTFNGNGVKDTEIALNNGFLEHLELQTDGKIILSGFDKPGGNAFSNIELFVARFAITQPASTKIDFDGDSRADLSVFRPNEGNWYINSSTNGFYVQHWGLANDKLTPADYDGDGKTDLAVYRESENKFYILQSSNGVVRQETFGIAGDDARMVGDWDGDGRADIAVYRGGSQGSFYYRGSNNNPNGDITFEPWGTIGDKPVRGDFDGDGKLDFVIFRPSNGVWYIRQSSDNQVRFENWGLATDILTPADFDGDGKTDLAIYRDGVWYIRQSSDNAAKIISFGLANDVPVPADYDGDGEDDIAVYRDGVWYITNTTNGNVRIENFGVSSDKPIAGASQ